MSEGMALRSTLAVRLTLILVAVAVIGMAVMGLYIARALTEMGDGTSSVPHAVLVGALLALGVALAVGSFIRRRVTRPVTEMQAIAHRWAQGDFSQRTPVTGVDEIAELGRTLNLMAGRLREKIADLEGERAKA
ncbi:MAG: HAMP domain-containing protein, partial [Candidatus Entotheonellia bacterium]